MVLRTAFSRPHPHPQSPVMHKFDRDPLEQMLRDIRLLAEVIGGRGSCTPNERRAGDYVAGCLDDLGLDQVDVEPFKAVPSTYWAYGLAFALALAGSLVSLLFSGPGALFLGFIFNACGFWGMLAETNLTRNWTHWFLPRAESQNIHARIPSKKASQRTVVICAHLDSHRTPIFYSSKTWQKAFFVLVGLTLISMGAGAIGFGLAAVLRWEWMRWFGLILTPLQAFALIMCLHADFTPFSPGANDNASGAAVALALARQLKQEPLQNTSVRLLFTGCEEVGDRGMGAFLAAHAQSLGKDTLFLVIDQVGIGRLQFLTADGLVIKRRTHPEALQIAREAARRSPELALSEAIGMAYTDGLKATQHGLAAITLCAVPNHNSSSGTHWHQASDLPAHIFPTDLQRAYQFASQILYTFDGWDSPSSDND